MMKRRILTMILAGVLALSLAACGSGKNGGDSANPGGGSSIQADGPGAGGPSAPDGAQPDAPSPSLPEDSGADAPELPPDAGSGASDPAGADIKLTLNRTDIELNKAGATYKLRYTVDPDIYDGLAVFSSSDTKVATVDESGTVKAVAPGKATITVQYDSATVTASVNCNWKEESDKPVGSHPVVILPGGDAPTSGGGSPASGGDAPTPGGDTPTPGGDAPAPGGDTPASGGEPSAPGGESPAPGGDASASANVDLSAFYSAITGKYEFPMPMLADDEILDNFYSGMTGIGTEQRLIYICGSSMNSGEFGLVQVKDGKDVDAVKAIFQARIDAQAGGGAWYPQAVDSWANNARVVSKGSYVMMVVHESCDDIVKEFNALF